MQSTPCSNGTRVEISSVSDFKLQFLITHFSCVSLCRNLCFPYEKCLNLLITSFYIITVAKMKAEKNDSNEVIRCRANDI